MEFADQARKYWHLIHWDASSFLTLHDNYNSRLFYNRFEPNLVQDLGHGVRAILRGIARLLLELIFSLFKQRCERALCQQPYLLLITVGGPKYASEEREIIETCQRKALAVRTVHLDSYSGAAVEGSLLSIVSSLMPGDYLCALSIWLWELVCGFPLLLTRDKKTRSLFVAVIPAIRQYCVYVAFARRIIMSHGLPHLILSLCPSSAMSVAIVEYMKTHGVLTAAIRTQSTSCSIEHMAINTDILFCKSKHERRAYEEVFDGEGPLLEEGCLLSLPDIYQLDPLSLPDEYVLLLGTAPTSDQDISDYRRFNEKLFQVAEVARLRIVFKGHNLAKDLDDAWFSGEDVCKVECLRIMDIRRNRELIDRASLVVSGASTLLYYAILRSTPVIIVQTKTESLIPDEFKTAPIARIAWRQEVSMDSVDWNALRNSSQAAKSWFEKNYYLQKGAYYLVDILCKPLP